MAMNRYRQFFESFKPRIKNELAMIEIWAGKIRGTVLRIAGILQLIADQSSCQIGEKAVIDAIKMSQYLIEHCKFVLGNVQQSQESVLAKRMLDWIKRQKLGEFTKSQIYSAVRTSKTANIDSIDPGLLTLIKHNYIRFNRTKPEGKGRPKDVYIVNPAFVSLDNDLADF